MYSCNSQTIEDVYRNENIPLEIQGKVTEIILYKGGNTSLSILKEDGKTQEIAVASQIKDLVKVGDIFNKKANSNKCMLIRRDSLLCTDCFNIPVDILKSLGKVEEWPEKQKGRWVKS